MEIIAYRDKYRRQIIDLILRIQNEEAKINLTLEEQPDILDIPSYYEQRGGKFWLATENEHVIGTVALMNCGGGNAVLKKFFVEKSYRKQGIGYKLYIKLREYAEKIGVHTIVLDTPSAARQSHGFYERAGFRRIEKSELPFDYIYPDRDSYLYLLEL